MLLGSLAQPDVSPAQSMDLLFKQLKSFGNNGKYEQALVVYGIMVAANWQITITMVNYLLMSYIKGNLMPMAEQKLLQLTNLGGGVLAPDVMTLNVFLNGYAVLHDIAGACSVLERFKPAGILWNIATFTTLSNLFARCGDVAGVEQLLNMGTRVGFHNNEFGYAALLNACFYATPPNKQRGKIVAVEMAMRGFNLQSVMRILKKLFSEEELKNLLSELKEVGLYRSRGAAKRATNKAAKMEAHRN